MQYSKDFAPQPTGSLHYLDVVCNTTVIAFELLFIMKFSIKFSSDIFLLPVSSVSRKLQNNPILT